MKRKCNNLHIYFTDPATFYGSILKRASDAETRREWEWESNKKDDPQFHMFLAEI